MFHASSLRYPRERVLLQRTRLAYVHLPNLLTDAKRDRTARVYGYVQVWLPEETLLLFLQEGEVVNATASADGVQFRALPIAEALAAVPSAAEFGDVCFHQCEDEQLAAMFASQSGEPVAWPTELNLRDPVAMLGFLQSTMHDGVLEIRAESAVSYGVVRNGMVVRGFFGADVARQPTESASDHVHALLSATRESPGDAVVRLWPVPSQLPVQAAPALIAAYRELMHATVARLVAIGATGAPAVAEHARQLLLSRHGALTAFAPPSGAVVRDPVTGAGALTAAIGAWLGELLWASAPADGTTPGALIGALARERRHVFQRAGLFETLPWKVEW